MSAPPAANERQIILTRPAGEAGAMAGAMRALGARVSLAPVIEFQSFIEENLERVTAILEQLLARGGWLILPSPAAVKHFAEVLARAPAPPRLLSGLRVATMGPAGAQALEEAGIPLDFMPPEPRAAEMARSLPLEGPGVPALILGSAQTRPELAEGLEARGARTQVLPLYAPQPCAAGLRELRELLAVSPAAPQVICVTSPSAVDAIANEFGLAGESPAPELAGKGWVAIGPTTLRQLAHWGLDENVIEAAREPNAAGIVAAAERLWPRLAAAPPAKGGTP